MHYPKTILLVEDNPGDVELTKRALRKSSIDTRLDVAEDGAEALDYLFCRGQFEDRDPNLLPAMVLLDINLPKIGGLEVLQHIRKHPKTKHVMVIVLTSSNEQADVTTAYSNGANSYIRKPVDFSEFAAAVHQMGQYWLELNEAPPCY
jgi:two-component system response regulator